MNRWLEIGLELSRLATEAYPEQRYLVGVATDADRARFANGKTLLAMESTFAKEIGRAVDEWSTGRSFQWPSDEHKKCFFYRASAAAHFALLHSTAEEISSNPVLPDPECSSEIAVRHLLKDWWYRHGCMEQAMSMLAGI